MYGYTNEAGEPIMSGEAYRFEQALDAEAMYENFEEDLYYEPDDEPEHCGADRQDEAICFTVLDSNGQCKNWETHESIARGLADSAEGKTEDLGDFIQYADEQMLDMEDTESIFERWRDAEPDTAVNDYLNDIEQGRYDDDPNPYHGTYSEE